MDKKMRKVTKEMRRAESNLKMGKKATAIKQLHVAEKKNEKLANFDQKVRDPQIAAYKKIKKVVKRSK